uniref:Lactation elevated protein 1-like n=1 Tax=Tetraselmis sp. GSL018 TaxID=582737 RepID=A0A061S3B3_9CHLO|mmetsp:Transcript_6018/g.14580  ORF Transcript_6018/g.14580 Transcript_6018/m.14580 type:complete len:306 (+) Transcript_6018:1666-2583(+)
MVPSLLCFDELQVTDVFAAVALKGLLEVLSSEGTVMVMTSNRSPDELNSHGLHEDLFNHFVQSLKAACEPVEVSSGIDYRRLIFSSQSGGGLCLYHSPLGGAAEDGMQRLWRSMVPQASVGPTTINVMFGRRLQVPHASGGSAWFSFPELCARPLGAADYIAVARSFHTVFLSGVPAFTMQIRDQARRFITLVDELYNHRVRLVCSAQDRPERLFAGSGGSGGGEAILDLIDLESLQSETAAEGGKLRRNVLADGGVAPVGSSQKALQAAAHHYGGMEEKFAFRRAVSRLYEMQTHGYLGSRPRH